MFIPHLRPGRSIPALRDESLYTFVPLHVICMCLVEEPERQIRRDSRASPCKELIGLILSNIEISNRKFSVHRAMQQNDKVKRSIERFAVSQNFTV